jgi:hypothetical protein
MKIKAVSEVKVAQNGTRLKNAEATAIAGRAGKQAESCLVFGVVWLGGWDDM